MNLQTAYADTLAHYVKFAQQKGWYAHSRDQVHKLDADESGLFRGIRAEVAKQLTAVGFVVPRDERWEWWL